MFIRKFLNENISLLVRSRYLYQYLFLYPQYIAKVNYFGLKTLKNPGKYRKSDILFILATGSSINSYSNQMFEIIKKHDSIALNDWIIHDFIPTFYSFEWNRNEEVNDIFIHNLLLRFPEYEKNGTFIIFRDILDNFDINKESFRKISLYKKNIFSPFEFFIPGRDKKTFYKALSYMEENKLFSKWNKKNVIFKKRTSIDFSIMIGFKMGYKKIILCGVDLNNTKYFYEDKKYLLSNFIIPDTRQHSVLHSIIDEKVDKITADFVIYLINKKVLKPNGVKLYTALKSSLLYPELPVFFDKDYQ